MKLKHIVNIFIILALCTCIDPYTPDLSGYKSLLVVEGLLTDAFSSFTVSLSRTFEEQSSQPVMVSDATVFVKDDSGNISYLQNSGNGIYKTDSLQFRGVIGRTYVLHIISKENEEYESDPCLMQPVPGIDSIYIAKDQKLVNNGSQSLQGISIYLDSKQGENNQYFRWSYDETWKFKVQYPKKYDYKKGSDPDSPIFIPVDDVKEFCWKNRKSTEILIKSAGNEQPQKIDKQPILFIASDQSDRLLLQYTILIKQYSISKNEYDFWNNLKQVNESGSDIFARLPYSVASNIHNINNSNERILGFFQVSALSQKRKNITFNDVAFWDLPFYAYPCKTWEFEPGDFDTPCMCPPKTWDDVYWYLCVVSDYTFIEPKYSFNTLKKMVFTRLECADCELAGSHTEPDFWKELKW